MTITRAVDHAPSLTLLEGVLAGARVDREARVIKDVVLLGQDSLNGRRYTEACLDGAPALYEGASLYLNHATEAELDARRGARDVRDLFGRATGVRTVNEGGRKKLVASKVTVLAGPAGDHALSIAEQMPDIVGMSHDANAKCSRDGNGTMVIEAITRVHSVDLVSVAATTKSLFESAGRRLAEAFDASKDNTREKETAMDQKVKEAVAEATKDRDARIAELEAELAAKPPKGGDDDVAKRIKEAEDKAAAADKRVEEANAKVARAECAAALKGALARATLPKASVRRLEERFKDASDKPEDVETAVREEVAFLRETDEERGITAPRTVPRFDEPRSDEDKDREVRESAEASRLAESAIAGRIGVSASTDKGKGKDTE